MKTKCPKHYASSVSINNDIIKLNKMKLYTKDQLLKKFKGKYIETYKHYDYSTRETKWEVRSVKNKIWENHNLPEEEITF